MKTIIDIGTNTILMLIAQFDYSTSQIKTILDLQQIPRLGKGVDANRNILPESIDKAINVLNAYKEISYEHGSREIKATATSFIRDAKNKYEFISEVKENTGIDVEILSGEDEARWGFWGGAYDKIQKSKINRVIDIGGGSTEVSIADDVPGKITKDVLFNQPISTISIDVGSVRIKERFLSEQPAGEGKVKAAEEFILKELNRISLNLSEGALIGVAGTVTTLGAIKLGLREFERDKIDNLELTLQEIEEIFNKLSAMKPGGLYSLGEYMEGREDIILSGTLILKTFMKRFNFHRITVSIRGLRYGVFLREVFNYPFPVSASNPV